MTTTKTIAPRHIPIFMKYPLEVPITVQFGYTDAGEFIVEHCTHAGATVEQLYGSNVDDDRLYDVYVCDKCGKQYDEADGGWYE